MIDAPRGSRRRIGRKLIGIVAVVLGLATAGLTPGHPAAAAGYAPVDVFASGYFCVSPPSCGTFVETGYVAADAIKIDGAAAGSPTAGYFYCGKAYIAPDGTLHELYGFASPGPTSLGFDGGTLTGQVAASPTGTELSKMAAGRITSAIATDPVEGTTANANANFFANNVSDSPISGTVTVSVSGALTDRNLSTGTQTTVQSSVTCTATAASTEAFGVDWESEVNDLS